MEKLLIVAIVLTLGALIWVSIVEQREWDAFAASHQCKVVGKIDSSTGVGPVIGQNGGVTVVTIPGKTGYLCSDGVTYWRSN